MLLNSGIISSNGSNGKNLKDQKIRLIFSDAKKLPFKSNSFDKVIASEVLEHIDNDMEVVKEVKRVLKPKGIFVHIPTMDKQFSC